MITISVRVRVVANGASSFVTPLRLCVRLSACNSAGTTGRIFVEFDIGDLPKICRENLDLF
jgi:hypothetical protein